MPFAPYLLVLEDDLELRSLVTRGLVEEGFEVAAAGTASELFGVVNSRDPDALVIDIGLPDADGRDVVHALRVQGVTAPVIFLTARDALPDRLSGFAAGGDDYLTKPFAFAELVARLHALIKRSSNDLAADVGDLRLDPATHAAVCGGKQTNLTPTEFRILARRVPSRRRGSAPPTHRRRLGPRVDRPRQHAGRLHRTATPEARLAPRRPADHHDPRRRLLAPVIRHVRLRIRTRLLLAVVGALALALIIGVTAFNVILEQRLSASAESLAQAQAQTELSSLKVVDGQLVAPEGLEERGAVGSTLWVFADGRLIDKPLVPAHWTSAASSLAAGPEGTRRVRESVRLYAIPVVDDGTRIGTVVAGVSLDPYEETATIALVGSIVLAVVLLAAVALLTHWILGKAFCPCRA